MKKLFPILLLTISILNAMETSQAVVVDEPMVPLMSYTIPDLETLAESVQPNPAESALLEVLMQYYSTGNFTDRNGLVSNANIEQQLQQSKIESYPCPNCCVVFKSLVALKGHQQDEGEAGPIECRRWPHVIQLDFSSLLARHPNCPSATLRRSYPYRHILSEQGEDIFSCEQCDNFAADSLDNLKKHIRSEHFPKLSCPYCSEQFDAPSYLAKHLKKHDGKPFMCQCKDC